MSHQITDRDGVFTVRTPAWHGLDTCLSDYPTRQEAQALAHPWEPVAEPIFRRVITIDNGVPVASFEPVDGHVLNARSDDGAPLGVVTDTYTPVTNGELYDIAEAIEGESDDVKYETGGSLYGGRKVWLLLRLREPITVGGLHGETIPYLSLQNAHDGSGSLRGQSTMVRIVCDNTAQMADMDAQARGTEFTFSHTKNIAGRIEQAKDALAGWRDSIERYNLLAEHMVGLQVTTRQRELFLAEFVPLPQAKLVSDRVVANVEAARQAVRDLLASPTCEGIDGTAWGLVQASIEYGQHVRRTRNAESAFRRAYLDRSLVTSSAVRLAQEVALAS